MTTPIWCSRLDGNADHLDVRNCGKTRVYSRGKLGPECENPKRSRVLSEGQTGGCRHLESQFIAFALCTFLSSSDCLLQDVVPSYVANFEHLAA